VGHALTTILAVLLLAPVAVLTPAILGVRGGLARVAAGITFAFGGLIAVALIVSPFHGFGRAGLLIGQVALASVVITAWMARGRPAPISSALPDRGEVAAAVRAHPMVAAVAGVAAVALAYQLVMGVLVTPNTWDSMIYHLARPAFWLQQGSLAHFAAPIGKKLLSYPPNGEILQGWTMAESGGDRLASAIQWAALVGLMATIACGARVLGFGRAASLWAVCLFALLPQPLLQAGTTQNDLIVSFFICGGLLFGVRGLRDSHRGELATAAVALGLAVGTKGTALFALPSVALILGLAVRAYRPGRAVLLRAVAYAAGALIALGSFNYIENIGTYGDPIGPGANQDARVLPVSTNFVRTSWSFVETPGAGMPWLDLALSKPIDAVVGDQSGYQFPGFVADTAIGEDLSAYGYVGWLILIPLLGYCLFWRRVPGAYRAVAAAAVLYLLVVSVVKDYDPYISRLLMPMVAIAAPLLALLYRREALATLTVFLALAGAAPVLIANAAKPLFSTHGQPSILDLDRDQQQAIGRPDFRPVLGRLSELVPDDAPIGLILVDDRQWVYPYFGEGLQRRVKLLTPEQSSPEQLRKRGLAGAVWNMTPAPPGEPIQLAPDYWFVRAAPG
jgi:dolichyl-phosphate-mannose-protein mannosyltransferase